MTPTTCHMSISLDGFVAGPDQSRENPIGVDGLRLHQWHFRAGEPGHEADVPARDDLLKRRVPILLGRRERLFDGVADLRLEPLEVILSPHATHIRYAIGR